MPTFLLRSLLRELVTELSGPSRRPGEPTGEPAMRYLIVVARNEPALYEHLRSRHRDDPRVQLVVDRRGARDVTATDAMPRVERRKRRSWLTSGASHELVELARQETVESPNPTPQPGVQHEEAPRDMIETETLEDAQRVARWIAEAQHMLGRVIPAVLEERDRLRQALEAKEQECERLTKELGEVRHGLGATQGELDKLRGEHRAIAEAFGGAVGLLGQLQQPLGEIARRLHMPQPVKADTPAA